MRTLLILALPILALAAPILQAQVYLHTLSIEQTCVEGNTLYFSVFLENTGLQGFYLASSDFIIDFNPDGFCSPTFDPAGRDNGSVLPHYVALSSVVASGPGRDVLALALVAPDFASDEEFREQVRYIGSGEIIKLATLQLRGICDPAAFAGLGWSTEALLNTEIHAFSEGIVINEVRITDGTTFLDPPDIVLQPGDCPEGDPGDGSPGIVSLHPNPARDEFRVRVAHPDYALAVVNVTVYDLAGLKITSRGDMLTGNDGTTGAPVTVPQEIASGTYIVEVTDRNGTRIGSATLVVIR